MFLRARQWGLPPSEFWAMTLTEWVAEADLHDAVKQKASGKLTEQERDELIEWVLDDSTDN